MAWRRDQFTVSEAPKRRMAECIFARHEITAIRARAGGYIWARVVEHIRLAVQPRSHGTP